MEQTQQNYQLDPQNPQIIFILGGPGSGKGTQCERLVRDYHFEHISVGDVIRDTIKRGGDDAEKLTALVEKGELIPDAYVIDCLESTIKFKKAQKYLIDGFPRNIDQAKLFESQIKEIDMIVNVECPEELLVSRLMKRALTSGRKDDNEETIQNRIRVYKEKTMQVTEYYKKFGKIKTIDGSQTIDNVYAQVRAAIKPNIIFFMGPPAVGKTTVAKILSQKLKYLFLNLEEFSKQNNCRDQTDVSNALMKFCQSAPHNCIIVDSFFTDHNQADVFFKHFSEPQYVFYLDSPKDEVFMNISKYYNCTKQKKYQQDVYGQYVQDRVGLLKLMQGKKYFKPIKAATTIQNIVEQIFAIHKPLTLVSFDYNNRDLGLDYYDTMEKERQFIYCDMEELIENEVDRGTQLGRKMGSFINSSAKVAINYKIELVQKVMFNEPDNTKFIFSNWPSNVKDFSQFEKELYPIDYLLNFKRQDQEYIFKHQEDAYLQYYAQGKVIDIDRHAIDILDSYTTPRSRYGFVTGPSAGGKSTIAKHIAATFDFELIDFTSEAFQEKVKAKYIKEDDEQQEVTYKHIEQYFIERLDPSTKSKTVIFDSFPYENELTAFIEKVGKPTFIVNLRVNKDPLIKRYKEKNEMDKEAELGEEDQVKLDEFFEKDGEQTEYWTELSKANFGVRLYNVNGDLPLESTKRYINQIFYKRVFVVSDYLDYRGANKQEFSYKGLDEIRTDQRLIFLNLCAHRGITFVDVKQLLENYYKQSENNQEIKNQYEMRWSKQGPAYASNYTPQLILQVVQDYLDSLAHQTRDVLLYNYPSADNPVDKQPNEVVFPRSSDELKLIEDTLGPVRCVAVLTKERVEHQIQDPVWEMEKPEEKPKAKVEGEEGEEAEKEAEEEDGEEGGKPKFNVFDFTWTKSDGLPKTLPQWFNKTRKTLKKHYSLQSGSENTFDKLNNYLDLVDEENEQNKEEQDFRKVNLFVQLRYDDVQEEHEEDPVEPESEEEQAQNGDDDDEEEGEKPQEGEQQANPEGGEGEAQEEQE